MTGLPLMNGRVLLELFDEHPDWCDCPRDAGVGPAAMVWTRRDGVYRPSDFDTPLHESRGPQ